MNKAFWQGFCEGYWAAIPYGVAFGLGVFIGIYGF